MADDRKRILSMIAEGKISVEEGERLLEALGTREDENVFEVKEAVPSAPRNLKYLRVMVESKQGDNVNVRVPTALLRAGLKLSALVPPMAYRTINEKMAEKGVDLDINALLKSGDIEQVIESLGELNVDVNSAQGDKVRVFFE